MGGKTAVDGRYRIDNNLVENGQRPVAVGRRGYLFCGNDDAAKDAAVMYTVMGCCKAAGVNVYDSSTSSATSMSTTATTPATWPNSFPATCWPRVS